MAIGDRQAATVDPRLPERVDRRRLLAAQAAAADFYRTQLATDDGAGPSRFLARIGVPIDAEWAVGFAPDRPTAVVNQLRRTGFTDLEIRASGLVRIGRRGQLVDHFRNRVVVGIRDGPAPDAPVVGFVGYAPPTAGPDVPACLYSPGTALYRPLSTLFGVGEQLERVGHRPIVAAHPLDAIAVAVRTANAASPPLVVAPAGPRMTQRHVELLADAADLSAGVGVTLRRDDEGLRSAERAYRKLAPVVGGRNVLLAGWATGLESTRSLAEALVVARVEQAAEADATEATRQAASRAAVDLLPTEDPEVGARLGKYMARRLGPEQAPEQLALDLTPADPAPAPAQVTPARTPEVTPSESASRTPAAGSRAPAAEPPAPAAEPPARAAEPPAPAEPAAAAEQDVASPTPARPAPQRPPPALDAPAPPARGISGDEGAGADPAKRPTGEGRSTGDEPPSGARSLRDTEGPAPGAPDEAREPAVAGDEAPGPAVAPTETPGPAVSPDESPEPPQVEAHRFRPTGQQDLAPSTERARVRANLDALRALKQQLDEERPATPAEQALYARWSGWGATPTVFDERAEVRERYAAERAELRELLDDQEYRAARRTTLDAHYTDASYVQAIWKALGELGFSEGRLLEPGCGGGNFIGFAPEGAHAIGVELDPTTAAMAQALYPDAQIRSESFANTSVPNGTFDLVVGNVPFGSYSLRDPQHNPSRRHPIHNHFLLKSLRLTRPGGVVALITSHYTMDGQDDAHRAARAEMGLLGDLLGAVRLPTGAHSAAAGTSVVTDLIVLRRRGDEPARHAGAWQEVRTQEFPGVRDNVPASTFDVNEYFLDHPEMVLGEPLTATGPHGPRLEVRGDGATTAALGEALDRIVAYARETGLTITPPEASRKAEISFKNTIDPEGLFKDRGNGRFARVSNGIELTHDPPKSRRAELSALIGLRDTALALLDEERDHREDTWRMNELRVQLNQHYDQYLARYGPLNRFKENEATGRRTYPGMGGFRKDPFWSSVKALESFNEDTHEAKKADIFHGRVVKHPAPVGRAASPDDALVITWDLHNEIRLDEVARLLGLGSDEQARQALGTLVYDEPGTGQLIRKSEYLSGNVRRKLAAAEAAAKDDPRFEANVEALRAVVPRDLTPGEIEARLGSPWIDASYVQQFLRETLEDPKINVSNLGARWSVKGGDKFSVLTRTVWGTERRCAQDLAQNLLNSQTIEVVDKAGDATVKHDEATAFAQAKAQQLDRRFREWLWEEPERAEHLGRLYNDRFNSLVPQSFDGEHITAPGMSATYELRPHQMAAVARIRNTAGVGLFHGTGAGKTLEMIVGGMELVRLGLATKPAYVVPKKVVDQFAREFQQAYPLARVLAVDSEDLTGDKRRDFIATCANGNWDAVIISHTAFKKIPVSKEVAAEYLEKQKARLEKHLEAADDGDKYTVKEIEKQVATLGEKIKDTLEEASDPGLEFERTGIGYLFIDEAHVYKNLMVISSIQELAHPGNQITSDLDMKLSYLRETYGRRVVTLATATPVDNSPSEILTMTKYAAPERLEEMGILEDDQFHATFIQPRRRLEMTPDGSRFESRTRHARYVNLPELKRLLFSWADVKLKQHLNLPEPSIVGGREEILTVPASTELRHVLRGLAIRARSVTGGKPPLRTTTKGEEKQDNILWISTDGRLGSLDVRLLGWETNEPQKVDVLADRIAEIWREHRDDVYYQPDGTPEPLRGSLQLVFCDLGVPGKDRWSFYEALRDELTARGLPADQVRFAQDAKTRTQQQRLQQDAIQGKIAVLIGSRAGLGTGVNVQRRVVAVTQGDPTWKLTPLEQSLGRGKRQGNVNKEIHHIFAVTEGSYDPFLWQKVDDKGRFTSQVLDPDDGTRTIDLQDDGDGRINPAVMFAVGAGKPELMELYQLEETVGILKLEQRIWHSEQFTLEAAIKQHSHRVEESRGELARLDEVVAQRRDTAGDAFEMTVNGRRFDRRAEAGLAVLDHLSAAVERGDREVAVGELGGFELHTRIYTHDIVLWLERVPGPTVPLRSDGLAERDPTGLIRTLENRLAAVARLRETTAEQIERLEANIAQAQARVGQPFPRQQELEEQSARFEELRKELETLKAPEREATTEAQARHAPSAGLDGSGQEAAAEGSPEVAKVARELRVTLERFRVPLAELEADALTDPELVEAMQSNSLRALVRQDEVGRWVRERMHEKRSANEGWEQRFADAYYDDDFRLAVRGDIGDYLTARSWMQTQAELQTDPAKQRAVDDARAALDRAKQHDANGDPEAAAAQRQAATDHRKELARLIEAEFESEVGPPGPTLPPDPSGALRRKLSQFRSALVALEAEALTDRALMEAAEVNTSENFVLAARKWVNEAVVSKVGADDGWEPSFMGAYFDTDVKEQVSEFIVARVWSHRETESTELGADQGPSPALRAVIGDRRSAVLAAQAEHLRRLHADRDAAEWRTERDRAAFAFDELDRDAAGETWRLERTERRAIEGAHNALARVDELARYHDNEAAEVQRQEAAASRRELAAAIEAEWQLFEDGRHLSDWMATNHHPAAIVIAADRQIAVEAEVTVDNSTERAQASRDVGVGMA